MKIVCDNCSAKYSIADEKVAGKVFKIRCKKCTNVIVVRGDQLGAEQQEAAPAQGFDYGGDAVWHVVIDGDQQGPYAPAQIGQLLTEGTIDWEAYIWREGFDGWKPARDVPELVAAVTGDASQAQDQSGIDPHAATAAAAAPLAAGADAMGGDPMGADPFAAAGDAFGGGAFEGAPTEAAREAPGGDAGADLFAQADAGGSPFGGVDDDVVASAASPRVSTEDAMTGQRNENSVLFSLSNLQALATGGGGGGGAAAPAPAPSGGGAAPGHASGEGSGLIDIRALASATASTGGATSPAASTGASDLLSIGGGGGLGSSLGAPVLAPAAPEPEKNNKGMIIGIGVAAVMMVGLLVALIVVLTQKPEPVVAAQGPGTETTAESVTPAVGAATTMDMPAAGAPVTSEMTENETESSMDEPEETSRGSSHMRRRDRGSMRGTQTAAMSDPDPTPAMTSRMASGSIDDLLNQALGGMMSSSMMTAAMASSMLPPQPSRDDVGRALRGVSGRVGRCGNGTSGVANAAITFASSGRVRSVRVTGVPPAVQSCVARTVRSARVSPFSRPTFNVNFPFRVR